MSESRGVIEHRLDHMRLDSEFAHAGRQRSTQVMVHPMLQDGAGGPDARVKRRLALAPTGERAIKATAEDVVLAGTALAAGEDGAHGGRERNGVLPSILGP